MSDRPTKAQVNDLEHRLYMAQNRAERAEKEKAALAQARAELEAERNRLHQQIAAVDAEALCISKCVAAIEEYSSAASASFYAAADDDSRRSIRQMLDYLASRFKAGVS